MAWLSGWDKRIELAIDYTNKIGASVTWFPVTIHLKDANGDSTKVFEEVTTNSRKIAITKADGTTELKGEIEQWSYDAGTPTNSVGIIHTSLDGWAIDDDMSIYLYYDNDHADNDNIGLCADGSAATHAVWDGNFKAVYHLVGASATDLDDSTSNNNDVNAEFSSPSYNQDCKIGKGVDLDGGGDGLQVADSNSLDLGDGMTLEGWLYLESLADGKRVIFMGKRDSNAYAPYIFYIRYVTGEYAGRRFSADCALTTPAWASVYLDCDVTLNTWKYCAITGKMSTGAATGALDDAALSGTYNNTGTRISNTMPFRLGYEYAAVDPAGLDGKIDEIRVSGVVRSTAWLKGSYNSGNDSLLTYGSEESNVTVSLSTLGLTATLQALTIDLSISVELSALGLTASQPAPTQNYDYQLSVSALGLALSQQTPSVEIGQTILPSALGLGIGLPSPVLNYDYQLSVSALGLNLTQQTPTLNYDYSLGVSALGLEISQPVPTFTISSSVLLSALGLEVEPLDPTLTYDYSLTVSALGLTLTQQTPVIAISMDVLLSALGLLLTLQDPTLRIVRLIKPTLKWAKSPQPRLKGETFRPTLK